MPLKCFLRSLKTKDRSARKYVEQSFFYAIHQPFLRVSQRTSGPKNFRS
ncbi:MAG: hypothetical protein PWQ12_1995 [Clostridiales bacterium]|nr:hypothetical protein [Clostridiales bacterium]